MNQMKFCVATCQPLVNYRDKWRDYHFNGPGAVESNRLCRRLQLKDIIPVEMQRLTKYPLLLENIAMYTGAVALPYTIITLQLSLLLSKL